MSEQPGTWLGLAREVFPNADDARLDWILWERTTFPMGSLDEVRAALERYRADPAGVDAWLAETEQALSEEAQAETGSGQ